MTSPEHLEGSMISQFISLAAVVRNQTAEIEALKKLPRLAENLPQQGHRSIIDDVIDEDSQEDPFAGLLPNINAETKPEGINLIKYSN